MVTRKISSYFSFSMFFKVISLEWRFSQYSLFNYIFRRSNGNYKLDDSHATESRSFVFRPDAFYVCSLSIHM